MAVKFVSERNIKFLLYEVFDILSLTDHEYYSAHNKTMFDMVLKEAVKLAKNLLLPSFQEMDRTPPELVDGEVRVHPSVKTILKEFGEGGWLTSTVPFDRDGEQLPHMIADTCQFIFAAANYSANVYPGLIIGASRLLESFGSKELCDIYVPRMRSGEWQGTMALTEPEAGSSLSDLTTMAKPTDKGYHLIKGQKIFISAGSHDAVENVVHMMLVKIEGGPPNVKGISLFMVPNKRVDDDGALVSNDIVVSGVYHKLGYRGCPITQLSIGDSGDCRGWLIGEPHNGLKYMFQMMNSARIEVGMGATSMASAAYYASLDYTKTRCQGRKISDKNPALPQIPIIEHADVKRMLLFQRAVVEGSLSLLVQCSKYEDMQHVLSGEEKRKCNLLLDLLTPIAKTYPSENGSLAISQGLQCFGGSGYCDDYPLEQYYRDARIHPIHEGTTGIHGIDLLGRKVVIHDGQAFDLYLDELKQAIETAGEITELASFAKQLDEAKEKLEEVTRYLLGLAKDKGPEIYLADATLYLELFGLITIAWQWLLQGISIQNTLKTKVPKKDDNFYKGKMYTLWFFFGYELVKTEGLIKRLMNSDGLTVEMQTEYFFD
ncbi:MAG: acyl-CoA dehydrogenase [Deltaproteobacteria bacterium]|nr:acyl-CoA dehydrogenase [Deltaproteobacteria bacterium]